MEDNNITQKDFELFLQNKKIDISNNENNKKMFDSFLVFQKFMNAMLSTTNLNKNNKQNNNEENKNKKEEKNEDNDNLKKELQQLNDKYNDELGKNKEIVEENNRMKKEMEKINKTYAELEVNFSILKIENDNLKMN